MKIGSLFFFLLFIGLVIPCNGSNFILVPAVIGDGSGLVNLSVRLIPGSGDIYLSTFPQTGTSTQMSVEDAANYAFSKTNTSNCDAIVKIDTKGSAGFVDGPSAGAALSVLTYSTASGIPLRRDSIITGSVDMFGNVGPVGGLYEKAIAAQVNGADYFIIPQSNFFDILLLRSVNEDFGIKILEATDADSLIGFMLMNGTLPEASFERESTKLPDIPDYNSSELGSFRNITERILEISNKTVNSIPEKDNESKTIKEFFVSEAAKHRSVMEKGYLFSAANDGFLDYIEASTISAVIENHVDLENKKETISSCLDSIPNTEKTDENFEFLIGSDLRKSWATNKLNSTDITKPKLTEEKFIVYNELMFADAWCIVSKSLADSANTSGEIINESTWMNLAKVKLDEIESFDSIDPANMDHYESALELYSEEKYGASVYDSMYVIQMEKADENLYNISVEELENEVSNMLKENRSSLWGKIYQTQGAFLANTNATGSALRILYLAKGLDNATAEMESSIIPIKEEESFFSPLNIGIILSIFLIIFMLLFYITTKMTRR